MIRFDRCHRRHYLLIKNNKGKSITICRLTTVRKQRTKQSKIKLKVLFAWFYLFTFAIHTLDHFSLLALGLPLNAMNLLHRMTSDDAFDSLHFNFINPKSITFPSGKFIYIDFNLVPKKKNETDAPTHTNTRHAQCTDYHWLYEVIVLCNWC